MLDKIMLIFFSDSLRYLKRLFKKNKYILFKNFTTKKDYLKKYKDSILLAASISDLNNSLYEVFFSYVFVIFTSKEFFYSLVYWESFCTIMCIIYVLKIFFLAKNYEKDFKLWNEHKVFFKRIFLDDYMFFSDLKKYTSLDFFFQLFAFLRRVFIYQDCLTAKVLVNNDDIGVGPSKTATFIISIGFVLIAVNGLFIGAFFIEHLFTFCIGNLVFISFFERNRSFRGFIKKSLNLSEKEFCEFVAFFFGNPSVKFRLLLKTGSTFVGGAIVAKLSLVIGADAAYINCSVEELKEASKINATMIEGYDRHLHQLSEDIKSISASGGKLFLEKSEEVRTIKAAKATFIDEATLQYIKQNNLFYKLNNTISLDTSLSSIFPSVEHETHGAEASITKEGFQYKGSDSMIKINSKDNGPEA